MLNMLIAARALSFQRTLVIRHGQEFDRIPGATVANSLAR